MHDAGPMQCSRQAPRDRMGGVAPQVSQRAQDPHPKPARLHHQLGGPSEGHQLAGDFACECAGKLEWVPLTTAKQPLPTE